MINHPHRARKATRSGQVASDTAPARKPSVPRKAAAKPATPMHNHDADYAALLVAIEASRVFAWSVGGGRLFMTDVPHPEGQELFDVFLDQLPAERQIHTCSTCRGFMRRYGALAAITEDGAIIPAMWNQVPEAPFYRKAVLQLGAIVGRAQITGPFLSSDPVWGTPITGTWTHMAAHIGRMAVYKHGLRSAEQAMAAKREDFDTVARALAEFKPATLQEACRLLETESLFRSEKFVGPVKWLQDVQESRGRMRSPMRRDNVLWRAVMAAPEGYCHPRASVIGSLLEDIADGKPFETVKRAFNHKVNPIHYQRPQAAPAEGNIVAGEKIIERLGLSRALERRYARLEDIETIWRPQVPKDHNRGGVFGHLESKGQAPRASGMTIPQVIMTWVRFARDVLPTATAIELAVPAHGSFIALTTALHRDAPPLLRWDRPERRNPVGWYVYAHGSPAFQWGLVAGLCPVTAVALLPSMWGDQPQPQHGEGAVLILSGARDRQNTAAALFPEQMRSDLHEIRATIEAYSKAGRLHEPDAASACGYDLRRGSIALASLRVQNGGFWTTYTIDRWE